MAQRGPISRGGEETLSHDSDEQFKLANIALQDNDSETALGHFLAAREAINPRQDVIDKMYEVAQSLTKQPQHVLLMADYYLAVAEFSGNPGHLFPALNGALSAAHRALRQNAKGQFDPERITDIAFDVMGLCPMDYQGGQMISEASGFIARHIATLQHHDHKHKTNTAKVFLNKQMIRQALRRHRNPLPMSILQGHYRRVCENVASGLSVAAHNGPQPGTRLN